MRKIVGMLAGLAILAFAGTALAGPAATDSNGDYIDMSVSVSPPVSSTAHVPRGVGVTFNSFSGNRINANDEIDNTSLQVRLNQNFTTNSRFFPSCAINPTALSTCSKAAQIGAGTAEGDLLSSSGGPPAFVPATLTVYNGKPYKTKDPTEIFIASIGGKPTTELDFTVTHKAGGVNFNEILFSAPSSGPHIYLAKFNFTQPDRTVTRKVKGKRVKIHLLVAPTSCHGAWTFSQTLTFATRPPLTATSSEPCVKG